MVTTGKGSVEGTTLYHMTFLLLSLGEELGSTYPLWFTLPCNPEASTQ